LLAHFIRHGIGGLFLFPEVEKMKKSMSQVDFEVDEEGTIFLTQESMCNENGYDSISFTKEQAPIIIKWIQDAINE